MTPQDSGFILPIDRVAVAQKLLDERRAFIAKIEEAKGMKKFIPEYCIYVVDILETGAGIMAFQKAVGATKAIVKKWAKENPEFMDALDEATAARGAYWENQIIALSAAGKSTAAAQWMLKNIDPDEYKDKTEVVATNHNHNVDREAEIKEIRGKFNVVKSPDKVNKSGGDAAQ